MAPSPSLPLHLSQRLLHPHYFLNLVISLPVPTALASHLSSLSRAEQLSTNSTIVLVLTPLMFGLSVLNTRWDSVEGLLETASWLLQTFNLVAILTLNPYLGPLVGAKWWTALAYLCLWFGVSFFTPQPPYLGPSKLTLLSTEEFDEQIAIVPPAISFSANTNPSSKIVEVDENEDEMVPEEEVRKYEKRRKEDKTWRVVLFHADWIRKSRELEITLSRLSWVYTSPTLAFHLLTPEISPQTFYDLNLSTHASTMDLPTIFLFHKGKAVAQLPKGSDEVERERRKEREEKSRSRKLDKRRKQESEESEEEEDGSDDEREVERRVALERYRWDRSGDAIVRAFKLNERSGLFASDGAKKSS